MKMATRRFAVICLLSSLVAAAHAQPRTVLSGVPSVKVSEGGLTRTPETVQRSEAANLVCVISEIDGKYYWASRENKPLVRIEAGAFVTYVALDGSGYVRQLLPSYKRSASMLSSTEETFDYVEHLLSGLRSITYYGTVR
jgi:hypothetical protein